MPTREPSPAPRPRTRSKARRLPARRSARRSSCHLLAFPSHACARRLEAGEHAQLVVGQAARERRKAFAFGSALEPACDEPLDRRVQLVGRHAAEERPPDLGIRTEAAADEDVVRLSPLAALVASGRALEAEIGNPVLRARVRAAVELQAQIGDLRPEALLQLL